MAHPSLSFTPQAIDPRTWCCRSTAHAEALFALVQAVVDRSKPAAVVMPNPFYQIYEGAAILAGAQPIYLNTTAATNYLPDLDSVSPEVWNRCQVLFCVRRPIPPVGHVARLLKARLALADRYDFVIASDECYSEIYLHEARPPWVYWNSTAQPVAIVLNAVWCS